jgi:pyruvate,water dikinase
MKQGPKFIAWFNEITKNDIAIAGGKGANLGEMVQAQISVPPGFIVTADAYFEFIKVSKLASEIRFHLSDLDVNDSAKLQEASSLIMNKILASPMPANIAKDIKKAYSKLDAQFVAVRSSATAEDLPDASFAGQQRTFLNMEGVDAVVKAVQGCWASLFEQRAIFYRNEQKFDHLSVGIAVPVQTMIQSETSGVLFTIEPLSNDTTKIFMEAIYGLGELIVSGEVTPDHYLIDKNSFKIVDKKIVTQTVQLIRKKEDQAFTHDTNTLSEVPVSLQSKQKLSDKDIVALAKLGMKIEELYKSPQDIEWAKQGDDIYIVQTRPVTTLKEKKDIDSLPKIEAEPILTGIAASPGIGVGPVKIVSSVDQIGKVEKGDILVAEMTTPDWVPAMKRAKSIITDRGGRSAHAAIVSRELSIPCVVGTEKATTVLSDGQIVTVDAYQGKVYSGKVAEDKSEAAPTISYERIATRTKVYVNLADPDLAEVIAARHVDGVGLLRAEFIVAQIGRHPRAMLHEGRGAQFVEQLTQGITTFVQAFHPRPVVYRTTDFKTNEYRHLTGGEKYEELEENPMIGYRGCSRYTSEIEVFRMEVEAIKRVCSHYDNLYVMIPFVRFVEEMTRIKNFFIAEGLYQFPNFKLWMMVEVPSNVFLIEKFIDTGIDGISIGSNDLTQLTLGIDRDNAKLAPQFDERNEAVQIAIEKVVKTAIKKGITCSICGQAPSDYPEITEKLVQWGITSVSVNPDMIDKARRTIAAIEEKLG